MANCRGTRATMRSLTGCLMVLLAAASDPSAQGISPGGVTGAALWVKADVGLVLSGATQQVTQWNDQSGSGNTTTQMRAAHPAHTSALAASNAILRVANAINFNPAVDFSGASGKSLKGNAATQWDVTPVSIFTVALPEGAHGGGFGAIFAANANWTTGTTGTAGVGLNVGASAYSLDGNGCSTAQTTSAINQPRVVRGVYTNGANNNGGSTWLNGVQEGTGTSCATAATTLFEIGGRTAGDAAYDTRIFNGKIGEVIVFRSAVTAANSNKIESYLAIKYGITLRQTPTPKNYFDSAAGIIWDGTANTTYRNNIAGIGRDDTSALNQKQSRSVNTANYGNLVIIGLGAIAADNASNVNTFGADRTFMIWGDDGASPFLSVPISGLVAGTKRMGRIWKVDETGTVGTVQVRVPAANLRGTNQILLRSVDATFDSGDTIVPLTLNGANYEGAVDLADGNFFTFAAVPAPGPGGVSGMSLWLRGDQGMSCTTSGCAVTQWQDASGNDKHANVVTGPLSRLSVGVNFNPALQVAAGRRMNGPSVLGTDTHTNGNVYIVSKKNTVGAQDADFYELNATGGVTGGGLGVLEPWYTDNVVYWDAGTNGATDVRRLTAPAGTVTLGRYELKSYNASTTAGQTIASVNQAISLNGRLRTSDTTMASYVGNNGAYNLGAYVHPNGTVYANQAEDIAELVVTTNAVTPADHAQIQSYLALKYGITLMAPTTAAQPQDYVSSQGTAIWSGVANAAYHNDVAGIGRDDGSALAQKQSASINAGSLVTVGLGTIAADNASNANTFGGDQRFLIWGRTTGAASLSVPVASTPLTRMARIWRVQETGTVGSVVVRIPVSAVTGSQPSLIRSADATFDGADTIVPLGLNGANYEATVDFTTGAEFFTFASVLATPGGVGGSVGMWFKADAGITLTGTGVDAWQEQSGNGILATSTQATDPLFVPVGNNEFNFNPSVDFLPAFTQLKALGVTPVSTNNPNVTIFGITRRLSDNQWIFYYKNNNGGTNGVVGMAQHIAYANDFRNGTAFGLPLNQTNLTGLLSSGGTRQGIVNGDVQPVVPAIEGNGEAAAAEDELTIGSAGGGQAPFTGRMGELIVYDRTLAPAEYQRVSSYLAIKYGITLPTPDRSGAITEGDYTASNSTKIWDFAANTAYHNNVAGIGRDDTTALVQRQSRSINPAELVTIGLGTIAGSNALNPTNFVADRSFMVWGHDNASASWGTDITGSTLQRMARVWKVQETGTVGTVRVRMLRSVLGGVAPALFRSTDATFTSTDTQVPLTATTDGVYLEADIDFASGDFFTFASENGPPTKSSGDGYLTDGDISGMDIDTPTCFPNQFWEHAPISVLGVYRSNVFNYIQGGYSINESTHLSDVDNDGKLDILWIYDSAGASANNGTYVWLGNGDGTFQPNAIQDTGSFTGGPIFPNWMPAGGNANTESTHVADVNGDGSVDIVWLWDASGNVANSGTWVWLGNGDGTFQHTAIVDHGLTGGAEFAFFPGVGLTGNESTQLVDVDNDGRLDIVWVFDHGSAADSRNGTWVWRGNGDGTWVHTPIESHGLLGGTGFAFSVAGGSTPNESTHLGDVDGDGFVDLVWIYDAAVGANSGVRWWKGNGNGTFQTAVNQDFGFGGGPGFAFGAQGGQTGNETTRLIDVNRDGILDILWTYDAGGATANSGTYVYVGNGNGTFNHTPLRDVGSFGGAAGHVQGGLTVNESTLIGDVNGDNMPDIVYVSDAGGASASSGTYVWLGKDSDKDGLADLVDPDDDNDGIADASDVCVGPGSINPGMQLWLKADAGTSVNAASTVIHWADQSPFTRDANLLTGDPARVESGVNFNPTVQFDGNDYLNFGAKGFTTPFTTGEVFVVTKDLSPGVGDHGNPFDFGGGSNSLYTWSNGGIYVDFGTTDRFGWDPTTNAILDTHPGIASVSGPAINTGLYHVYGVHAATSDWGVRFDGTTRASTATNTVSFADTGGAEAIGATTGFPFHGEVAEAILYNRTLTTLEREQVHSYLGTKYGITIGHSYRASDDTTIYWDMAANATYHNNVAGIGRDDGATLNQKQSTSSNPGTLVAIGHGTLEATNLANANTFAADLTFMMWGDNNASTSFNTFIAGPSGIEANRRMARAWKVQETAAVGAVTVGVPATVGGDAAVYLVVSADETFDAADQWLPLGPLTVGATAYKVADIDLASGQFFTFASSVTAPGGVADALGLWLKADAGTNTTTDGVGVSTWADQSGAANDGFQGNAAATPLFRSTDAFLVNFNPTLAFDSANDFIRSNINVNPASLSPLSVSMVYRITDGGGLYGNDNGQFDLGHFTTAVLGTDNVPAYTGGHVAGQTLINGSLYNHGAANGSFVYVSGRQALAFTYNAAQGGNAYLDIGVNGVPCSGCENYFGGVLPEYILYRRALTLAERQQVDSYLAIKYGVTLLNTAGAAQNYLSSRGIITWDGVANSAYHNDVAGIGRDDATALVQRQSASANPGNLVTIGLGTIADSNQSNGSSFAADHDFLIWGRDSGAAALSTPIATTNFTRMARMWRVQETGTVGAVVVRVPASSVTGTQPSLIRSADATIDASDTFVALTLSGANYEATLDFAATEFFTFAAVLSQPGGVTGGLQLWLRGDLGVGLNGANASLWADQSGAEHDALQGTAGSQPLFQSSPINFNPGLRFIDDAAPDFMPVAHNLGLTAANPFTLFGATSPTPGNVSAIIGQVTTPLVTNTLVWGYTSTNLAWIGATNVGSTLGTAAFTTNTPRLIATTRGNGGANVFNHYSNGGADGGGTAAYSFTTQNAQIGSRAANDMFDGVMSEVIVYSRTLTTLELQRVHSYLAIKYGVTLDQTAPTNYVASDGSTVAWNATTNAGYKTNIAGIGRDDLSALVQRQSKSVNSGEFVTIGLGEIAVDNATNANDFAADKSFLIWGHDNASTLWGTTISGSTLRRMARVWKTQETGTVGTVVVRIPQTVLGGITPTLVRSTDATFDSTDTLIPMTLNGAFLEATIDFASGDFFTFASENGPAIQNYGDGYLTDGIIAGMAIGTPACYPPQYWEHVPIVQQGVYTGGNGGVVHSGLTGSESTYLADVNNDGTLDLLALWDAGGVVASNGTWAWLGNGDGTFQTAAIRDTGAFNGGPLFPAYAPFGGQTANESTHIADVNGDGSVDIVWLYDAGGVTANAGTWVWLGNGDGTFQHTPLIDHGLSGDTLAFFPAGGSSINESTDLADVNNDGRLDIVWVYDHNNSNNANNGTWVWLGNGDGTWAHSVIRTSNMAGGTGFTFTPAGGTSPNESTHIVDIDKDGFVDLVWLYDAGVTANSGVRWWKGNGNGTFQTTVNQDLGFAGGPGLAFGAQGGQTGNETTRIVDVNLDGNLDILWIWDAGGTIAQSGTYVYLGNGNGTFNHTPQVDVGSFGGMTNVPDIIQGGYSPEEITLVGDLNEDGMPDIFWGWEAAGNVATSGTWVWLGKDTDADGAADAVDPDDDGDGLADGSDTCLAPGSIDPSMQLWLKADMGLTVNASSNAIHWADQSPFARDANLVVSDPQRIDAGVNFNPTVWLDGDDRFQFGKSPFVSGFTAGEVFAVTKNRLAVNAVNGFPYDFGSNSRASHYTWNDNLIYEGFGTTDRLAWNPITKAIGVDGKPGVASIAGPGFDTRTYHVFSTHSAAGDWGVTVDGVVTAATSTNTVSFTLAVGNEHVGATAGATIGAYNGEIAEVILYNRTLTASERFQVESYLGTKYGITIGHNYLASDDTTVYWDMTANAAYHNDVAGIGRDDMATLSQKQSGSINPGNVVSIALGAFAATNQLNTNAFDADRTFMLWGHDNASATQAILVPGTSPTLSRFARVWKVQETLTVGTVTVRVPLTALKGSFPTLIRSTDATFDGSDQQLPMTPTATDYEVTIDFANGDFFTFAAFLPAPGGVTADLDLWVKANDGTSTTAEAANVATWLDRSGSSNDLSVTLPAAAVQPTFKTTSLNFNPGVSLLNDTASNQAMWNQFFLGSADGNYSIDASVFVAHTLRKTTNCSGFATFTSPSDGAALGDHPWMGHCSALSNQLAMTWSGLAVQQSGASMTATANNPYLHGFTWRNNIAGSLSFRQNGAVSTSASFTPVHSGRDFYLWRDNNDNNNDGASEANEAIVYTRQLTALENQKVESYLAVKYGITLTNAGGGPQDYLNSAGATIWAGVANPVYHNAVAGIMHDGASALDQRVSQSVTVGDQIAVAVGTFDFAGTVTAQSPTEPLGDGSSLVWGHNNGSNVVNILVTDPNAQAAGIEARMARIWRDQITGAGIPAQLSIRVPATLVETGNPTLRTPALLISPDPTFASGTRVVPLTAIPGFYAATFTTFSATETYFTIAGATSSVTMTKAFSPTSVAIGGTTRLIFTLTNASPVVQSGLAFTDTLPSGLVVAATPNSVTTCGPGAVSASGSVISLSGGEVVASGSCAVEVDVTTAPSIATPLSCPAPALTNGASNVAGLSSNLQLVSGFGACVNAVQSSDVAIVKAAPATFDAGATVAYTITVTNNGPSPAAGVTVADVLPAQLTFVSSPSCSAAGQTVTCNLGTLTSGQVVPITLNVQVAPNLSPGTVVNNTATVASTSSDPVSTNNSSTVASPAATGSADLSIVKSTVETSVTPGATFTYRLVVTNNGPSAASNMTAADTLPAQVSFVTSPSGCTVTGQDVSCGPVATLDPSTSHTFDIVVRLEPSYTGTGADIGNVATTTSATADPNTANNTSSTVLPPTVNAPSADLSITKTAVEPSVTPGDVFTYRMVVTNNGPSTAVDVGITDTLAAQLAFVSSPSGCTAAAQTVTCGPAASLAPLAAQTFDIVVRLDPAFAGIATDVTNTATVTSPTADPDPSDNTSATAPLPTVNPPAADLQIVKSVTSPAAIAPGEDYTYTLTITNNGPSIAHDAQATDALPPQIAFVSSASGCTAVSQNVTCLAASPLGVGASQTFVFTVEVGPSYSGDGSDILNTATVSATTSDPVATNNTSPAGAPPVLAASADVAINKSVSPQVVAPGDTFTYTFLVSNQGPSTATGITVTDTLPADITFESGTGCSAAGQDVTCTLFASLLPGQFQSVTITVRLASSYAGNGSDRPNVATVSTTTADPTPSNDTSDPPVFPNVGGAIADVAIAKAASAAPVIPGQTFTYTLTVDNTGPSVATGVVVSDVLPADLTFVSSPQSCAAAGQTVTCPTLATLGVSASAAFDIVVRLNPSYVGTGANILNTATVATASTDPNLPNNTSNAATPPSVGAPSGDVSLTKAILESSVVPGGTFTYRVTASNAGPSTATNVQITDPLPVGVAFVSSPSGCTGASGTVTCGPLAAMLPSDTVTFDFVVRLDPGYTGTGSDLGNVATATGFTPDPNTANNSNAPVFPNVAGASADVSITKAAVEPSVVPGQSYSYTILVSNAGPSVAVNSVVTDTLPAGLTFVSASGGCTAAGQVVTCPPIASLATGSSSPITLVVRLDAGYSGNGSDLGNIASVTSATADPDTPNNTSAAATAPTVLAPSADVQIVKSVSSAAVLPGENFTYTLTVTNNGPSNAANILATDTLPAQVTFVSSADGCTAAGQTVSCPAIGTLGVGASTGFTFGVQLDPDYTGDGSDVLNSSMVTTTTADPAMANNSSPAGAPPVGPGQADLAIRKDVSTTPVTPGTNLTYTLTVSNQGPSSAFGFTVADALPVGVTFVSSPEGCTASGQNVSCSTAATLAPGSSIGFTLIVHLDAGYAGNGSDISNTATVASPTPDPTPANNTSNPATPIIGTASSDVSMAKSVVEASVTPGGTFTYRLVVTNNGPSTALGIQTSDALPPQVAFVSSASGCTALGPNSVACPAIGSLAVGASVTFDITARLDAAYTGNGSDVLNTASVSSSTPDPTPGNNTTPPVPLPAVSAPSADASITKVVLEPSVTPGQTVTYRLTISNTGPSTSTNIVVADQLPPQMTFVSSPQGCTAGAANHVDCPMIASLAPNGTPVVYDIVARLDPSYTGPASGVVNSAAITPATADPNIPNNASGSIPLPAVNPPSADLSVAKAAVEPTVIPGGTITYQVTVTNNGPSTAVDAQIDDTLPAGLTFQSSASGCTAAAQTVTCSSAAAIAPGGNTVFTFVVRLSSAYAGTGSDLGNVATVSSTTADPLLGNNTSAVAPAPPIAGASADLSVTKDAVEPSVTPGLTFSYDIVVANAGPSDAANVVVTDTLPAGLTFVSSTGTCTAVAQNVTCPLVATLSSGASTSMTVTVRLDAAYSGDGSDLDNVAVVSSDTADPNTGNNTSAAAAAPTVNAPSADVQIVKSVSADPLVPGQNFTYTLTITNNGPSAATGVDVTDTLPVQTTFVASPEGCMAVGQSVTCPTVFSLDVGSTATFTIVVQLDPAYGGSGADILNSAIVAAVTSDPAMANNTSPAGAPPVGPGQADVAITKDVSASPVTPGATLDYTLRVTNQGPSDATDIVVTDTLPIGVAFSSSAQGCTVAGQAVTCPTIGTLGAGAAVTFTVTVVLDPSYSGNGSDIPNTATVTSTTTDPIPANNTSNSATPVVGTPSSDVSIAKTVVQPSVTPGGTFTYRLMVTNNGPSTALGVHATDTLPAQVTFVSSPQFCNASGQSVTCPPIGSLAVGGSVTFDLIVRLDASYAGDGSDVLNIAAVASTTPDPDPSDNQTPPVPLPAVNAASADVSIAKAIVESSVVPGQTFTYRLTVTNDGPSTATTVQVTDALPSRVAFVSSADGCTAVGQTATCPVIAMLFPGGTQTFDLLVQLDPSYTGNGSDQPNVATVMSSSADPDATNNSSTPVTPNVLAASADLVTTKMALEPSVTPGTAFTYRVTVLNNGPSTAVDVQVTDMLPAPLAFVSSASACVVAGQLVTCPPVATMLPGTTVAFEFVVRLDPAYTGDGTDLGNTATATSSTPDPDPTNNTTPPAPPPAVNAPSADVQIVKSVSGSAVAPGETYAYTLTITNHGPSNAVNVVATDSLPLQATFVSSAAACTAVGQSVTCPAVASLLVGATASFDLVVRLDPSYVGDGSDVLNVAIALAQTADPFMANNSSRLGAAPVGGANADLAIVKDVSTDPVTPGTNFFYRVTAANQGPSTATNVVVTDPLPVGVIFQSSPDGCTAVGQAVTCPPVPSLPPGQAVSFVLVVQLDASYVGNGNDIQNVASVSSSTTDPVPGNNTSNPATPVIGVPDADVAITKSVVESSVAPGGIFTYRLVVSNTGPSTALGVVVTDPLPAQVAFVSSPQGCTAAGQLVTCPPLGSMAVGASVTFDLRVRLDPTYSGDGSDVVNVATASSSTRDPVPSNGTSAPITLSVMPTGVDIGVALTAAPMESVLGDIVTFTATVANQGPEAATGLTISLPLPSVELIHEGATTSTGGYDPASSVWTIGNLPVGGTATLQLQARVNARGRPTVTAATLHIDQIERNPADNSASVTLYLTGWSAFHADLVLTGSTTPPVVAPGALLGLDLTAVNRGPGYVVDLFITGDVPAGATFAGVTASPGALCTTPSVGAMGTVRCEWPGATFVDPGAKRTMTVGVRADPGAAAGTSLTTTFQVSSDNPEFYAPSNQVTLTTAVADGAAAADLSLSAIMQSDGQTGTALATPLGVPTPMRFTVRNNGPAPTAGARYLIEIPPPDLAMLQIRGASWSQGAVALAGLSAAEWTIGALAPGATATFDLTIAMMDMHATTITMRRMASLPADLTNANDVATLILDGTGHPHAGERFTAIGNVDGVGRKEILTGAGRLEIPQVRIYDGTGVDTGLHFLAYVRPFVGGVRLASCDIDRDGVDEIITGPGIGPGPHVRVFRLQNQVVREIVGFYAFDPSFPGGVYVSCADIDHDGRPEVITSMGEGGSEIRVFDVARDVVVQKAAFSAYEAGFTGGARVATLNTTEPGGSQYQLVTVNGPGRPLEVRTWAYAGGTVSLVRSIALTGPEYQLGAFIDVADLNGDSLADAVLSTDRGIPALIGILTLDTTQFQGIFQAYPSSFLGGTRVTLGDVDHNGRMELLITQGYGGRPIVDAYSVFGGTGSFVIRLHPIEIP